eukprot:scaffold1850_cov194-Pinguiococcus_pyrenoidosus.AAC.26
MIGTAWPIFRCGTRASVKGRWQMSASVARRTSSTKGSQPLPLARLLLRCFGRPVAEAGVIDELRRPRYVLSPSEGNLPEAHRHGIVDENPSTETLALAEDDLDAFRGLDAAHRARQHAQHAPFRAGRYVSRRRRLRQEVAVARPPLVVEDGCLSLEAQDGRVAHGLLQDARGVVHEVSRGEVVGSVDDDVVVLEDSQRICRRQHLAMLHHLAERIEIPHPSRGRGALALADAGAAMDHLPLQVAGLHHISIDDSQRPHARCRQVQQGRRPQASRAHAGHPSALEAPLPLHAHVPQDEVSGVPGDLRMVQLRQRAPQRRHGDHQHKML